MNILSISQIQTKNSSDMNQILPIQSEKSYSEEKASFSDFLKDARNESQKTNEKISSDDGEKVVKTEEKAGNTTETSDKISQDENNADKNEKSEKIAYKKSSENEKNSENIEDIDNSTEESVKIAVQNLNVLENAKNSPADKAEKVAYLEEATEISGDKTELDEKTLSWLMASNKIDESEEISNEDFAKMIDAAVEFIPGYETEGEKLENAQNLASSDPELFLQNVENFENLENISEFAQKIEVSSDKKIGAESKEKKLDSKIAVHDLRTHRLFEEDTKIASDKIVQKAGEKKEINLSMQKQADGNLAMTMELANRAQENITSQSGQAAGANGSDFQAMLSNAVQENASDFVKAGNIVLKDNNQGTINLILRPEGLGNVKISLNLDDKNLSAQIVVHTKEAMEAFKESIPSLKQAFTESGFETGSFDLNFSNNNQGFAQGGNDGQNQQHNGILAHKTYGDFVTPEALSNENSSDAYIDSSYGINIVA